MLYTDGFLGRVQVQFRQEKDIHVCLGLMYE